MSKVVLISGGSSGFGRGAARELLQRGYCVATFSTNAEQLDEVRREFSEQFSDDQFLITAGDVTDEARVVEIVDETVAKWGTIDIVINNAGFGLFGPADEMDMDAVRRMIDVNIAGVMILTKAVLQVMKKQNRGHIVNITSSAGKTSNALSECYAATKFAVMGYSDGLRKEVAPHGIKVSTVCPGMARTRFFTPEELEKREKRTGKVPFMLETEDVVRSIVFVCTQPEHCNIQDLEVMPFGG